MNLHFKFANMKKICMIGLVALCAAMTATAQTNGKDPVWQKRATYLNVGLVQQDLSGDLLDNTLTAEQGFGLSWGRTFYLHKRPISRVFKVGLDWTWLDLSAAQYAAETSGDNGIFQADAAMQIGPSITVNPFGRVKLAGYAHFVPTYSSILVHDQMAYGFVKFYNYGATLSWRLLSVGVEYRKGLDPDAEYKVIDYEKAKEGVEEGKTPSLDSTGKAVFSNNNTVRFFVGLRF